MRTSLAYAVSMGLHGLLFGVLAYAATQPEFLTVGFAVRAGDANGAISQERHARHLEATFDTQLATIPSPPTVTAVPLPKPAFKPTFVPPPETVHPLVPADPVTAANLDHQPVASRPALSAPSSRRTRTGSGPRVIAAAEMLPTDAVPSSSPATAPAMIETPLESSPDALSEAPVAIPEQVAPVDGVRGLTATAAAVTVQPLESGDDDVDAIGANSPQGARVSQLPSRLPRNREPTYPEELRRQQVGGTVLLRVTISADGAAEDVTLAKTSGYRALDESALEAVRTWRFEPARRNKIAVRYTVKLPITFSVRR